MTDSREWIEWTGEDRCPVPSGTAVTLRLRFDNLEYSTTTPEAELWGWAVLWGQDVVDGGADIIAYRGERPA